MLNVGEVTLQTLVPKKKAAQPHAPFARVTTPQTTKDVQNIKHYPNIANLLIQFDEI
jgi:hypothetical protein